MIILDTNVVSELMRPTPSSKVLNWVNSVHRDQIFSTVITLYEIEFGIARLPLEPKRNLLQSAWNTVRNEYLVGRILNLDPVSASLAEQMKAAAIANGDNSDICDLLVAAIAKRECFPVATRNTKHFTVFGVDVINPWQPA